MVARTCLNVTLYVHCLSCFICFVYHVQFHFHSLEEFWQSHWCDKLQWDPSLSPSLSMLSPAILILCSVHATAIQLGPRGQFFTMRLELLTQILRFCICPPSTASYLVPADAVFIQTHTENFFPKSSYNWGRVIL